MPNKAKFDKTKFAEIERLQKKETAALKKLHEEGKRIAEIQCSLDIAKELYQSALGEYSAALRDLTRAELSS